jgi:predicted RNA-binding protein YlqC (UPF0109 family)
MAAPRSAADLVEFLAKGIVTQPEAVKVREAQGGLELETAADDRGRVIGRQGRIAKALRAIVNASRAGRDVQLEIVD